ncbi:biotin--[acetyl-CoA-carboxylase] ligase [Dyella halodurans]|uniref:Bifunctional ligase/repressor BirA n=1 Tax=Dyella halodurans TaxID=1920171 RepID=A0ABV9BWW1_9GAMM|nr:biotin--[acetyl-CoA-carboxylase] ligase [Dyella halodurans]
MQAQELLVALAHGDTVSGAFLAERAGVTRAAIWKQVEALRARGVPVESRGTAGYCLPWPLQVLGLQEIRAALPSHVRSHVGALELHWEIDSTSNEIQRRLGTLPDLSMILAETQSAGRGRRGRAWLSPPGLNVYLSCLKRFDAGFAALSGLSLAVGVIVMRTLAALGIQGAGLKWPNDVLSDGGKLAGILVELSGEYQGPCAAIIGVGVNVRLTAALREQAGQPINDLANLAHGQAPDRNLVAASLIAALVEGLRQFEHEGFAGFVEAYGGHDLLRGKPLHLQGALGELDGVGAGVDARGALLLQTPAGVLSIDSADVTVRRA